MPPDTQVKLLRALENHEVTRVGGRHPVAVNVRVVSATNRDIEAQVAAGTMRADLWYRLAVLLIHVPPLRERRDDIPLLSLRAVAPGHRPCRAHRGDRRHRTERSGAESGSPPITWPGNVRELHNVLERARLLAGRRAGGAADAGRTRRGGGGELLIEERDIVFDGARRRAGGRPPAGDRSGRRRYTEDADLTRMIANPAKIEGYMLSLSLTYEDGRRPARG